LNPPADGTRWLPIGRNEDFGRSPFWAGPNESVLAFIHNIQRVGDK
jgi:hypothetical protein